MHADTDEDHASLSEGRAVLSFSVGDTADFLFSSSSKDPEHADKIMLRSGDALIFGGPARKVFHGIAKIHHGTAPRQLQMRPGRLNITLREHRWREDSK